MKRASRFSLLLGLLAASLLVAWNPARVVARVQGGSAVASERVVACRVLEVETSTHPQMTLVVFHHREAKDRDRLGMLLRQLSGASVEFQAPDSSWHTAAVLRLKSCFGRGALLFSAGEVKLGERDTLLVKFPASD